MSFILNVVLAVFIGGWTWAAPPPLKDSPLKKVEPPAKKLILACYDEFEKECAQLRRRLEGCEPKIQVLDLPFNASPVQYAELLKKEMPPKYTPLIIMGHGNKTPSMWSYSNKVIKHRPHLENFKLKFGAEN